VDVYNKLREMIITGVLPVGAPLTEPALARQFRVSRTPIREALRRLQQDGLIERGSRRMQVRGLSAEETLEIYDVRIMLETLAARAAAERRTEWDLMKLEQVHASMIAAIPDDPYRLVRYNRTFHETVWAMSHNGTLVDLLSRLHAHLIRYRETTLTYRDRWGHVLEEHRNLVEAIRVGDRATAGQIAEQHMVAARHVRMQMYAVSGAAH